MLLDNKLYKLFYKNNCVILPGFGGFFCNFKSSEIIQAQGFIHQATKTVSFNKNIITNDGLVYNFIALEYDITYDKAEEICKNFIQSILNKLLHGESVVFYNIGKLYLDLEKNIQFFPSQTENFALTSFGLKKIALNPLNKYNMAEEIKDNNYHSEEENLNKQSSYNYDSEYNNEEIEDQESELSEEELEELEEKRATVKRNRILALVAFMLLTGLGLFFATKKINNSENHQHAGFFQSIKNLFSNSANNLDTSSLAVNTEISDPSTETSTTVENTESSSTSSTNTSTITTTASNSTIEVQHVFGSFKKQKNAEELLEKIKSQGIQATIQVSDNGFKRVMVKTTADQAANYKVSHPGSWTLE